MTHGERWLAKAHARLVGYCKTRGWLCGAPRCLSDRRAQYEVFVSDRRGRSACLVFTVSGGDVCFVDDYGISCYEFDARAFDEFIEPFGLMPKPVVSKRQMSLNLEDAS